MPTFELPKNIDEIQEPELMPEDWYPFEISEDPTQEPNNAMKEGGPSAEKAGFNIVVKVRCIEPTPEYQGRPFTVWLPLPTEADASNYTPIGQTMEDSKMGRIAEFVVGFGGATEGSSVALSKGLRGQLYVTQGLDQSGQNVRNQIDSFAGARPFSKEAEDETVGEDLGNFS